jgi:hypothetical protein
METMFKGKRISGLTTILVGLALSQSLHAQTAPNPREVTIRGMIHGGTGCPVDSVAANISDDAKALTLFFDQFVAQTGGNSTAADAYKVCNLQINLRIPHGWSYTILGVDYRGFANLDAGVSGVQRSEYWLQGVGGRSIPLRSTIFGPFSDDYRYSDRLSLAAAIWSPCGVNRALNIKTSVSLSGGSKRKHGLMTVDSIDGELKHIYGIQWRRCR